MRKLPAFILASSITTILSAVPARAVVDRWLGATDANWDTAFNWSDNFSPGVGNTVSFDNAGNGNTIINLGSGASAGFLSFDTAAAAAYTIGGVVAGIQTFTLDPTGTTDPISTITLASNVTQNQLFNANIVLNSVVVNGGDTNAFTFASNAASRTLTFAGGITSAGNAIPVTLTVKGAGATAITGIISDGAGTVALTKTEAGTLTLGGANTYTGATTITTGTVIVNGSLGAGSQVNVGAAGTLGGSGTVNGNVTVTGDGIINLTGGTLAGTVGFTTGRWNGSGSVTGVVTSSSGNLTIGNGANLTANGGLNVTGGSLIAFNATSTLTGSLNYTSSANSTFAGIIAGSGKTVTMNTSAATLTLSGANTYTGATIINAGTVTVTGSLNGTTGTPLNFGGTGTFNHSKSAGGNQGMSLLTVTAGDATVLSTYGSSGNLSLTFSNVTTRTAGTAINFTTTGGTNGTTNKIVLTNIGGSATPTGALLNRGIFFGGSNYAAYDVGGFLRALNYGTDANAPAAIAAGATLGAVDATKSVSITGAITAQTTAAVNTLKLGTSSFTMTAGNVLSVNGLLSSGGTFSGGILEPTVAGGETVIRTDSGTLTLSSVMRNFNAGGTPTAVTKSGTGTLVLTGASIHTGVTAIAGGTLQFGTGADGFDGSISNSSNIANNAALIYNLFSPTAPAYSGVISGTGTVTKQGAGTLTLSSPQTYTGLTTISAGVLKLGAANVLPATAAVATANVSGALFNLDGFNQTIATITGGGTTGGGVTLGSGILTVGDATSFTFTGNISGTGGLTKQGSGVMTLAGTNAYTGPTLITAGTLRQISPGSLSGSSPVTLSAATTFENSGTSTIGPLTGPVGSIVSLTGGTLTVNTGTGSAQFDGNISGSGALTKSGSNTLTLNGTLTHTGATAISGGTLLINGTLGSGSFTSIPAGATLGVGASGSVARSVTVGGGTVNLEGTMATGSTLTLTTGTINSIGAGATAATVNLPAQGPTHVLNAPTGQELTITTRLSHNNGGTGINAGTVPFKVGGSNVVNAISNLILQGGTTTFSTTMNLPATTLTVTTDSILKANSASLGTLGSLVLTTGTVSFETATSMSFDNITATGDSGIGTGIPILLRAGAVNVAPVTTLTVSANVTGATSGLTKTGSGTLVLDSTTSTYTTQTTIAEGTLVAAKLHVSGGSSSLGNAASPVTLGSATQKGTLNYNGNTATYSRGFTVMAGGGEVNNTAVGQNLGLTTGAITGTNASLTLGGDGDMSVATNVNLGAANGSLTKTGSGSLNIFSGTQTYKTLTTDVGAGPTFVNAALGTGTTAVVANANISFGNVSQNLASLTIGAGVSVSFSSGVVPALPPLTTAYYLGTLSGSLGNWSASSGLSSNWATDSFGTPTRATPTAGTDVIFSATGATSQSSMTLGANMSINSITVLGSGGETNNLNLLSTGGFTLTIGSTANPGISIFSGSGTVTLSPSIRLGMAQSWINDGSNALTVGGAVDNQSFLLTVGGGGATNVSGVISGAGGLTKNGASTMTLSGANIFSGPVAVNSGTLKAGVVSVANVSGAFGNNTAITLANTAGATLDITGFATQIGSLAGGGASGGNITLGAAILTVGGNDTSPAAYAGIVSGTGGLTKIGSGTLTLAGANLYSGATTVTGGTLQVNGSLAAASQLAVGTSGTLAGSGTINGNATLTGNGSINLAGGTIGGTLAVTGGNWNGTGAVTGLLTSSSGTLTVGAGANLTANGNLNVTGGTIAHTNATSTITGSVNYTSSASSTFGGALAGSGKTLTMNNAASTLTLSGPSTYTGATTVTAGTLELASGASLGNTAITVNSGATLAASPGVAGVSAGTTGPGTAGATLTLPAGSTFSMRSPVGTFNLRQNDSFASDGLVASVASGTAPVLEFAIDLGSVSVLNVTKGVTTSGAVKGEIRFVPVAGLSILTAGNYPFITAASGLGLGAFTLGTPSVNVSGITYNLSLAASTPTQQILTIVGVGIWTNAGGNHLWTNSGNWDAGLPNAVGAAASFSQTYKGATPNPVQLNGTKTLGQLVLNTNAGTGYTIGVPAGADILRLDNDISPAALTVAGGTHTFNAPVQLDSNTTTLTISGAADTLNMVGSITQASGTRSVTKAGVGLLTFSGANTYNGGTSINGGTLALAGSGTLGATSGPVTMGGGTLDLGTLSRTVGAVSITTAAASGDTIRNGTLTASSYAASNVAGNAIVSATLNGSASLTKTGAGTLTLSGTAKNYTGGSVVNGGTLAISGSATLGAATNALTLGGGTLDLGASSQTQGAVSITAAAASGDTIRNGSLTATSYSASNTTGDAIVSANLNGSANLTKSGAGTLTLSGNNGFSGSTTISAGTVKLGAAGNATNTPLGTTAAGTIVAAGATLDLNGFTLGTSEALTLNGNGVSNGGALTNTSASAVTYSGLISLGSASCIVASHGNIVLSNSGTIAGSTLGLTLGGSAAASSLASVIGTSGGSAVNSTWTFNGGGSWSTAGNWSAGIPNGNGDRATFGAAAASPATITVNAGPVTVGGITFSNSNSYTVSGASTISLADGAGTPTLTTTLGSHTISTPLVLSQNATASTSASTTLTLTGSVTGGASTLSKTGAGILNLDGNQNYAGLNAGAGTTNVDGALGTGTTSASATGAGTVLRFGTVSQTLSSLTIGAGATVIFKSGAASFAEGGKPPESTSSAGGGGPGLTKIGSGTWTVSGANTYTGATTVSEGTLKAGVASVANVSGAFGNNSAVTLANVAGARLDITGFDTQIGSLTGGGATGGNVTLGAATLTVGGDNTSPAAYAGIMSGTGALTKIGTGTLTLSGANLYSGATTVNAGTLKAGVVGAFGNNSAVTLANASGVTLDITGFNTQIGSLTGGGATGGNITLGSATLTVGSNNTSPAAYAGIMSGAGGLTKIGTGTLTLSGANLYSGATTVNAGTLKAGVAGAFGTNSAVTLANVSGATLDITGFNTQIGSLTGGGGSGGNITLGAATLTVGGDNTSPAAYAGIVSGTGALTKIGIGALTLAGASTYSGLTTISAGTLKLGGTGDATNTPLGTTAAGTLVAATGAALDLNGFTLGTAEALTLNGTGVSNGGALTNSSASAATYSGLVTLGSTSSIVASSGNLILSNPGTISGATFGLTLGGAAPASSLASIIGTTSGTVTKVGAGTWTLSGANTYTGGTILNDGTLSVGSAGALGTTGTISFGGGTLQFSGSNTTDYSPRFSTAASQAYKLDTNGQNVTLATALTSAGGSLTKLGAGTLTVTAANTYNSGTNINGGTLLLSGAGTLGPVNGAVNMGGGTLDLGTLSRTVGTVTITAAAGSGDTIRNGTLTGTSYAATNATGNAIVSANLTGSAGVTKSGAGTLTLSGGGTNYTGTTTVSGGTLSLASGGVLANTAITVNSTGTFSVSPGGGVINAGTTGPGTAGATLTLAAGGTFSMLDLGTFNLRQNDSFASDGLVASVASGAAPTLQFALGTGAVSLLNVTKGVNTSGAVKGQITFGAAPGAASLTLGTYTFITAPNGLGPLAFTLGTSVITVGGSIYSLSLENSDADEQKVTIAEGGNLWTNGATNHLWTTAGNWTDGVPSGAGVAVSFAQAFKPATPNPVQLIGTKTVGHLLLNTNTGTGYSIGAVGNTDILRLDNGANTPRVSASSGTHIINSPVELTNSAIVTLTSSATLLTMVGNITQTGGARSLTKAGAGTLTLSGTNSYAGGTNIDAGTLLLAGAGIPLATTGAVTMGGGTLDLGTQTRTVGAVTITAAAASGDTIRNGTLNGSSYAASNTTGNAIVSASLNGTVTLTKSGAGTLTLTGTNGYTGATNVNGGTLAVQGPTVGVGPAMANTLITVATGATFAAFPGSGSVTVGKLSPVGQGGRLTLNAGSAFTMVDNAIGTFNLVQGAAFVNPGFTPSVPSGTAPTLTFEIGGSLGAIDLLNVTKSVLTSNTVKGQIIIQPLTGLTSLVPGNYTFMTAGGTTPGLGPTAFTLGTTTLNVSGNNYNLSLANSTTTAQILTIANAFADEPGKLEQGGVENFDPFFPADATVDGNGLLGAGSGSAVVPEPGSLGLLLVGSLGLLASRRRASGRVQLWGEGKA
jgi:autotransporter-associated beta strand protein